MERPIRLNVCSLTPRGRKTITGHCCIAATVAANMLMSTAEGPEKKTYELPDGNVISVGDEHFRCPEVQFLTRFSDEKVSEIYDTTFLSIMASHLRGDSGCFVAVCYETHELLRDKAHRGRTAQPMFEMFNEPAMPVAIQAHRDRMKQPMFVMFNVLTAPVATQADWYLSALRRATDTVMDSCDGVAQFPCVFGQGSCGQQEQRR